MKLHRHLVAKKSTALLLAVLMLGINAVKVFHTHTGRASHTQGQYHLQDGPCAICDFQLTRDADVAVVHIVLTPASESELLLAVPLHEHLSTFHIPSLGRAPPALA